MDEYIEIPYQDEDKRLGKSAFAAKIAKAYNRRCLTLDCYGIAKVRSDYCNKCISEAEVTRKFVEAAVITDVPIFSKVLLK